MIREIMKDTFFLAQPSIPATAEDIQIANDLLETLIAHKEGCVGMAANMIGVSKRIIAFENDGGYMVMFNPEIVKCSEQDQTIQKHQGSVSEREIPNPSQDLYRLDGADHSA